jgi:hypothetical protein
VALRVQGVLQPSIGRGTENVQRRQEDSLIHKRLATADASPSVMAQYGAQGVETNHRAIFVSSLVVLFLLLWVEAISRVDKWKPQSC